jgi:DHA2 family multidrug resistance protein
MPGDGLTERDRSIGMGVVLVGTVMVTLDTTIVNVALPQIRADLGGGSSIEWVLTAYLLAIAISQPATGWAADRFGRRRVYLASLAAFTGASLVAALSVNLPMLVALRVVQGFGGGALMPVGMAIVYELYPIDRRARAMALWGVASMASPAIGPTLGGFLVTRVSWHWLFLLNVPVGCAGLVFGLRQLRDFGFRDDRRLDVPGLLTGGVGLALALLGISEATRWGWASAPTLGCLAVGCGLLVVFVTHELRTPAPLIDLRMFRERAFSLSMLITTFIVGAQYTRLVFMPLSLEDLRGFSALRTGAVLTPAALGTALTMSLSGRMVDRYGPRVPAIAGTTTMATGVFLLGHLERSTPIALVVGALFVQGLGFGLCAMPTTVASLNALPASLVAQASAVRSLVSQVAAASTIAVLATLVSARMGSHPSPGHAQAAYNTAFLTMSAGLVLAVVCAIQLPRRGRRSEVSLAMATD